VKLPVLTAAGGQAWETSLVAALDGGEFGVSIARRCVDVVDLLSVAATGQARAALVACSLRRLDADAVDRLLAADVAPVAVVPRGDPATEERMRALGIDALVPDDAEPAVVAAVLLDAVRARTQPETPGRSARLFGDPMTSMAVPPGASAPEPTAPTRRGTLVAVWGPTGAPGRTTLAVTLADEIGRLGLAALLIDADVYGATVAATLGLLDDSPGLAAACRQAAATRLDADALAALCWQLTPGLRVLTGVPLAARWPELRPAAIESALTVARGMADFTVLDCGFNLEADEELSFDTIAPRRNGATLAVLAAADVLMVVGSADPIGMQRLVRALADLRELDLPGAVWVVLNRVRPGVVPGDVRAELSGALQRFAGCTPSALLPLDQSSMDAALATGRTLGEARPTAPLRRAVRDLAAALTGVPARSGPRRSHLLPWR
jgi:MinD-like ATPase involved in chromosome partitioning or flagellar assembly